MVTSCGAQDSWNITHYLTIPLSHPALSVTRQRRKGREAREWVRGTGWTASPAMRWAWGGQCWIQQFPGKHPPAGHWVGSSCNGEAFRIGEKDLWIRWSWKLLGRSASPTRHKRAEWICLADQPPIHPSIPQNIYLWMDLTSVLCFLFYFGLIF